MSIQLLFYRAGIMPNGPAYLTNCF